MNACHVRPLHVSCRSRYCRRSVLSATHTSTSASTYAYRRHRMSNQTIGLYILRVIPNSTLTGWIACPGKHPRSCNPHQPCVSLVGYMLVASRQEAGREKFLNFHQYQKSGPFAGPISTHPSSNSKKSRANAYAGCSAHS